MFVVVDGDFDKWCMDLEYVCECECLIIMGWCCFVEFESMECFVFDYLFDEVCEKMIVWYGDLKVI